MYVISATHSTFGRSAVKSRSTRSGACRPPLRTVVMTNLRRLTPLRPAWRIRRVTRFLPIRMPLAHSSAWMRGAPYVPFDAVWSAPMRSISTASSLARRDSGRFDHDITYIPTWTGFLYLAVALDAFSRRIVGWAMATTLHTQLVLDALNMALATQRP